MRLAHAVALVAAGFSLTLAPAALSAQSLSEAAAKEKERRKGKQAKVFTDDDLRKAGGPASPSTPAEPTATAAAKPEEGKPGAKKAEKTEEELRVEREADWHKRLETAQKNVSILQDQVNKIQADLNDMSGGVYSARRTTLANLLEETKKQLAEAQQTVGNLQEEGRRSGYR